MLGSELGLVLMVDQDPRAVEAEIETMSLQAIGNLETRLVDAFHAHLWMVFEDGSLFPDKVLQVLRIVDSIQSQAQAASLHSGEGYAKAVDAIMGDEWNPPIPDVQFDGVYP